MGKELTKIIGSKAYATKLDYGAIRAYLEGKTVKTVDLGGNGASLIVHFTDGSEVEFFAEHMEATPYKHDETLIVPAHDWLIVRENFNLTPIESLPETLGKVGLCTLPFFKKMVECEKYTDRVGIARLATATHASNVWLQPSEIEKLHSYRLKWATHVLWYKDDSHK